jgi:hypothetical protein
MNAYCAALFLLQGSRHNAGYIWQQGLQKEPGEHGGCPEGGVCACVRARVVEGGGGCECISAITCILL